MKSLLQNENTTSSSKPARKVSDRRTFLAQTIGAAGLAAAAWHSSPRAEAAPPNAAVTAGDIAVLKFLAAAELVECDLWQQYCELAENNRAFRHALRLIDPALPDYICQDFADECSHAQWINAFLASIGQSPVSLDAFRTLPSVEAQGALDIGRLTNLTNLTVDTSYYLRYRTASNPDFDPAPAQIVTIQNKPSVPVSNQFAPRKMQIIAQTAAFHFAAIEQGGSSLYNALLSKVTNLDVLRALMSIGSTEVYHFAAFQTSLEGIFKFEGAGVSFPALNRDPNRGKIMPKPCKFLDAAFPLCSVIRPRSTANAGAIAAATGLVQSGLFTGQPQAFFDAVVGLATAADAATRGA